MKSPALYSARSKVERAVLHLKQIESAIRQMFFHDGYAGNPPDASSSYKYDSERQELIVFKPTTTPVDPTLSLLVGDCIHNLRSALDHFEARTNASMSMTVRFVTPDARTELPEQNADETIERAVPALARAGPRYVRFIPAGAESSTDVPPDAEPAKPHPAANCRTHGPYAISNWQSSEPCPRCVEEAAEVERKLRNMMPGGGWA